MSGLNLSEEVLVVVGRLEKEQLGNLMIFLSVIIHSNVFSATKSDLSWISFHFVADLHGVWGCRIILDSNPCFFLNDYFLFLAQVLLKQNIIYT